MQVAIKKRKEIIPKDTLVKVFVNLEQLLPVNEQLLLGLEERVRNWSETQKIGDVFKQMTPFLKSYTQYCNMYEESNHTVAALKESNGKFKKYLRKTGENPKCNGLTLEAFLIMPVQRIPRYVLLLSDLIKHTPPTHVDHKELQECLQLVSFLSV